ncbi:EpsG family protein [Vibrio sp. T20]|uniref:EpsG family protein n=1 Tax=Vibrio sp. T20 TaxID=2588450 RepID=UPI0011B41B13|nr:EpsG family protein [Vibrio sp. T20]
MTIYFFIIILAIIFGIIYERSVEYRKFLIISFSVFFVAVFGFRYRVGVDWSNYFKVYERLTEFPFRIDTIEIGYKYINVLAYQSDIGMPLVIFLCTVLFIYFTINAPSLIGVNPFYFFAIVAPYHLVMSGVNYTRQGVALSIFIYAFSYLLNGNKNKFVFFILLASSFHYSSLLFLVLYFSEIRKVFLIPLSVTFIVGLALATFVEFQQYLSTDMDNAGIYLRVGYILVPCFFLLVHNLLMPRLYNYKRMNIFIYISVPAMIIISLVSTTMADRISYFIILASTLYWMWIKKNNYNINYKALHTYGDLVCFSASFTAFTIWCLYSSYIPYYRFDSLIYYWFD